MQLDSFTANSYPDLSRFKAEAPSSRRLRICIASEEIYGPGRSGGIATTYYHLARLLVDQGHSVTVLYLEGQSSQDHTIQYWIDYYADLGVELVPLPEPDVKLAGEALRWQARYYSFFVWLANQPTFDVVHTSEWRGGGYYVLLAKKLGLAFCDTLFLVKTSSPHIWNRHYQMRTVESAQTLACMFAEQSVVESADIVIGGSAHLLNFMAYKNYRMPEGRLFVQPNVIEMQDLGMEENRPNYEYGDRVRSRELVFFGRLEARKGLELFCDSLDRLAEQGIVPRRVTFLGMQGIRVPSYPNLKSAEYIRMKAENWPFSMEIIEDFDQKQAIAFLCQAPRIAVMPSVIENATMAVHETIAYRIPFIASRVGGTPELIDPAYHDAVLCDPTPESLTAALLEVLQHGGVVAKGAFDLEGNLQTWKNFHAFLAERFAHGTCQQIVAEMAGGAKSDAQPPRPPNVSLCLYHWNDALGLRGLLNSVIDQTAAGDEIIVVDDGSANKSNAGEFAAVVDEFGARGIRFLSQPHRWLGAAWNHAGEAAKGEVLIFLRADQHVARANLVERFKTAFAHSNYQALTCFFDQRKPADGSDFTRHLSFGPDLASGFLRSGVFGGTGLAVRREAFLDAGGFADAYHLANIEEELLVRMALRGQAFQVVPEVLYEHRERDTGGPLNKLSGAYLAIKPHLDGTPAYLERLFLYTRHLWLQRANAIDGLKKEKKRNEKLSAALSKSLLFGRRWQLEAPEPTAQNAARMAIAFDRKSEIFSIWIPRKSVPSADAKLVLTANNKLVQEFPLKQRERGFYRIQWRYRLTEMMQHPIRLAFTVPTEKDDNFRRTLQIEHLGQNRLALKCRRPLGPPPDIASHRSRLPNLWKRWRKLARLIRPES